MNPPITRHVQAGQRIGYGVVINPEIRISYSGRTHRGASLLCDCGTTYEVKLSSLVPDSHGYIRTKSCGCYSTSVKTTHGVKTHPLYATHTNMMHRCYNPDHHKYKWYGARGISVTERWHDVQNFIEDIERELGSRPAGMTLDRINNNGNYQPGNVRWSTSREQRLNQNRYTDGKHQGISWHKRCGKWLVRVHLYGVRIHVGYFVDFETAVTEYHDAAAKLLRDYAPSCCDSTPRNPPDHGLPGLAPPAMRIV